MEEEQYLLPHIKAKLRDEMEKKDPSILLRYPSMLDWWEELVKENIKTMKEVQKNFKRDLEKYEEMDREIQLLRDQLSQPDTVK